MTDDDLIRRGDALAVLMKAQVASCTCLTKTPDPDWHREGCRYRILREAEAMIEHVLPAAPLDAPKHLTDTLDKWLKGYTPGIDRAVRFLSIDQVDMLAEFYLNQRKDRG